ncbi:SDR family oxidoreductase [Kineosporia succinea]|uniref:NAD(P)-dependent dehydrogenase (Short-subunit alcohol dehydrogenase family) n=1 Tax=Kineosporia succinea TaxID=84632 RepID=A0ABT9PAB9_9ACTN|nr:SDR family oxidoreductase [Kineosporia succinea]MDP9829642.1 NAD(P)-dependent dehydrogenase (short-subunit alcohol dehydrogenase family) [Kineosporia succinea]
MSTSVFIGGTAGLGRFMAQRHADRGNTVIIAGRDAARAEAVAKEMGADVTGIAVDLARPSTIAGSLAAIERVDHLVVTGAFQKPNTLQDFNIDEAVTAVTTKLVGYTEAIRALRDRFSPEASVVVFGGLAKERPYPGSTVITTFNSAVTGLIKTLAVELAPHRINALHPALVGNSPRWEGTDLGHMVAKTPIGRLITMDEVADATDFLLRNGAMNGHDLYVDGGVLAH